MIKKSRHVFDFRCWNKRRMARQSCELKHVVSTSLTGKFCAVIACATGMAEVSLLVGSNKQTVRVRQ